MNEAVFAVPQFQHELIPQADSSQADQEIACRIKSSRLAMFELFNQKIDALSAGQPEEDNLESLYRSLRPALDACAELQAMNERRSRLQDRLWARVLTAIDEDRQRLETVYRCFSSGQGGLELHPHLEIPCHQRKADIHRMPGGYLQDAGEDDFFKGALYDHGVFLYGQGWLGPLNDALGQTLIQQILAEHYRAFQPQTILDMGCSVGHSTLPYASTYPQARVWGIDLGASMLRYAIARARALHQQVYFAQQNAEKTEFADQSFDLVVSHILIHEIPGAARKRIFAESYRLLKPGGLMVHLDSNLFLDPSTLVGRYFRDTEVSFNSEPYLASSKFEDFSAYASEAGFAADAFQVRYVPGHDAIKQGNPTPRWVAFCGEKR